MSRKIMEWRGRNDDHRAPATVRQRIFDRAGGICHLCKLPIKVPVESWDADHVVALINGGENRETNLAPAHKHCHVAKTGLDLKEKAKVAHVRQKHTGAARPKQTIPTRPKQTKARPDKLPMPGPRALYQERRP